MWQTISTKKHNENAKASFIEKAKIKHNNFYNETVYINSRSLINVICPKHGKFAIQANAHLNGQGCRLCRNEKNGDRNRDTLSDAITKGNFIHNNKYDYSLSEYTNAYVLMKTICPIHGVFEQMPYKHLSGHGCPKCKQSHLETVVEKALIDNGIKYQYQKRLLWLSKQSLDFYLPNYRIAIECQGMQHFRPITFFGGENEYKKTIKRDKLKRKLCLENGINILYFTTLNNIDVDNYMGCGCYTNIDDLLKYIKLSEANTN